MGFSDGNIILQGKSLGAGPSSLLAKEFKPRLLILQCPNKSIKEVVRDRYGCIGAVVMNAHFDNMAYMQDLQCPLLILHGTADSMVIV